MPTTNNTPKSKRLFWVDLEMTGLDEQKDSILEIAVVVTDIDFNPVEQYHRVVFQPNEVLENMNDWCKEHHGASGLTAAVPNGTPLTQIEKELVGLIEKHFGREERVVLAGNSVGNDKRFIDQYLPLVAARLHYRIIDVSSFKEVFREKFNLHFKKSDAHRAVDDIMESIKELKHYLSFVRINSKD